MKLNFLVGLLLLSVVVGCSSSTPTSMVEDAAVDADAPVTEVVEAAAEPTYDVALTVPTMNCPFACWPKVKETLEHQPGVETVTLAKQADENAIDNPTVYLSLSGEFSADESIAALGEAGFSGATVNQ